MAGEQIIIEYIANVDGLKAQLKTVKAELKAVQKESDTTSAAVTDGFTESEAKIQSNAQRLKELKKQLQDLTPGSSQFNKLAKEAGDLQNKINDATQATRAFAKESKLSTAKTLFGALAQDIKELDFAGAASKARQLASVVNGISFGEVAGGLKNLVATILNLGKALLLNPFVLIATSVAAATYAIYQYTKSYEINTKAVETNTKALAESAKTLEDIQKRIDDINQGLATADFGDSTKAFVKAQDALFDGLQKIEDKSKETFDQLKKDFGLKDLVVGETGLFDVATLESGKKISEDAARDLNNRLIEIFDARKKEELKLEQEFQVTVDAISKANVDRQLKESEEIRAIKKKYSEGFAQEAFKEVAVTEETEREKTKTIKKELEKRAEDRKEALDFVAELEKEANAISNARELKEEIEQNEAIAAAKQQNIDTIKFAVNELVQYQNDLDNDRLRQAQANLDSELKRLKSNLDAGLISEKAYLSAELKLEEEYDKKVAKIKRDQAVRDKALSAFNIVISTAEAIVKALVVPPPAGEILAGTRAAFGAVQLALVLAKEIPKFAEGTERVVGGQRGVDSVHAMLMPDEAVIKAKENMAYPGLSKAWNSGHLDEFIMENFITPKLSEALGGSTAENMAKSIKINGLDEYGIGRALRRNNGVQLNNAGYLAKMIAKEISKGSVKRTWS